MATFISIRTFVSPQITVTHLSFKNDTWNFCSNNLEKFIEERCICMVIYLLHIFPY